MTRSGSMQTPSLGTTSTAQAQGLAPSPTPLAAGSRSSPRSPTRSATLPISPTAASSRVPTTSKTNRDIMLPIACRLLPLDQWMTTYVKRYWGINEVKIILLARCANPSEPFPPLLIDGRPIQDFPPPAEYSPEQQIANLPSPDVNAESEGASIPSSSSAQPSPDSPPQQSSATLAEGSDAHNTSNSEALVNGGESKSNGRLTVDLTPSGPIPRRERIPRPDPLKQVAYTRYKALLERTGKALQADQFVLWRYSTGQLMETHMTLDTACIRPGEMIEIQRKVRHVALPRPTYVQPYFETTATVYHARERDPDATPVPPSNPTFSPSRSAPPPLPSLHSRPPTPPLPAARSPAPPPPTTAQPSLSSKTPKPRMKLEPRSPLKPREAWDFQIPPHPDEPGAAVEEQDERTYDDLTSSALDSTFEGADSLSEHVPTEAAATLRKKPRRQSSKHFIFGGSNRNYDNNKDDERDRWKGKEKETSEKRVVESGLLPPAVSDTLFGTSLPGIGAPSTPDIGRGKKGKPKESKDIKQARETIEHFRNPKNWKEKVVLIQDGTLWTFKEEAGNSQSPLAYNLSSLISVEEGGTPFGPKTSDNSGTEFCPSIRLRFEINPQDVYGKALSTPSTSKVVISVYIYTPAPIHEHLLRVFYCFLKRRGLPPPTTPNAMGMSTSTAPVPIASNSRTPKGSSPADQYAHTISPEAPYLSSSAVSSTHSLSSTTDSENTGPKKKRSFGAIKDMFRSKSHTLRGSPDQKVGAAAARSSATLQRTLTNSTETLSSSVGSEALSSRSPSSSPHLERKMSLRTAMRMGPEDKEEEPKVDPPFILWRKQLMKSCIAAGRGQAKLRKVRRGGRSVAHGPWQTDGMGRYYHSFYNSDADDTDLEEVSPAQPSNWRPRKRYMDGSLIIVGQENAGELFSEFEWETWKADFGFKHVKDYDLSRFGVPPTPSWSPGAAAVAALEEASRSTRQGLGFGGGSAQGAPVVSPKGKLVKPSPAALAGPMLSIAGSFIPGRTRSKSIQALPLRSPTASPAPRSRGSIDPDVTLGSPLTPSSTSSFGGLSSSGQLHRPKPSKSHSDFNLTRSRSTTISATSPVGTGSPSSLVPSPSATISQPPHYAAPSLSTPIPRSYVHIPQPPSSTRIGSDIHEEPESDDSGKSQVSLRSALDLPNRPSSSGAGLALVPPSPALSQMSSRWSQVSEAQMVTAHRINMGAAMGNRSLASARAIATMAGINPQPVGLGLGNSSGPSREISRTSSPVASPAPSEVSSVPGPDSSKKKVRVSIASRLLPGSKKPSA